MPSNFRFLLLCLHPNKDSDRIILEDIVCTLYFRQSAFPLDIELYAVVSAVLGRDMWGKPLDLVAWELDNKLQRTKLPGYAGTELLLPEEKGPTVCPYRIRVPLLNPGFYGFDLFDREGIFGPKEGLLATYVYGVFAVPPS